MKLSFTAFSRQETMAELWLKQILRTHKYLTDTDQIFTEERTEDELELVSKITDGNIKYCLGLVINIETEKRKTRAFGGFGVPSA